MGHSSDNHLAGSGKWAFPLQMSEFDVTHKAMTSTQNSRDSREKYPMICRNPSSVILGPTPNWDDIFMHLAYERGGSPANDVNPIKIFSIKSCCQSNRHSSSPFFCIMLIISSIKWNLIQWLNMISHMDVSLQFPDFKKLLNPFLLWG